MEVKMKIIQLTTLAILVLFTNIAQAGFQTASCDEQCAQRKAASLLPTILMVMEDDEKAEKGIELSSSNFTQSKAVFSGENSVDLGCYDFNVLAKEALTAKVVAVARVSDISNSYFRDLDLENVSLHFTDNTYISSGENVSKHYPDQDAFIFGLEDGSRSRVKFPKISF